MGHGGYPSSYAAAAADAGRGWPVTGRKGSETADPSLMRRRDGLRIIPLHGIDHGWTTTADDIEMRICRSATMWSATCPIAVVGCDWRGRKEEFQARTELDGREVARLVEC